MDGHTKWPKCNHEENNDISFTVHTHWPPLCRRPFGFPPNALITAVSAWEANEKKKETFSKLPSPHKYQKYFQWIADSCATANNINANRNDDHDKKSKQNRRQTFAINLNRCTDFCRNIESFVTATNTKWNFRSRKKKWGKNKSVQHWPFRPFTEPKPKKSSVFLPMLPFRTVSHWMCC